MKKFYGLLTLLGVFFFAAGAWAPPGPKANGGQYRDLSPEAAAEQSKQQAAKRERDNLERGL